MKTLFVEYTNGERQLYTDTAANLLDFVLSDLLFNDLIQDAEIINHIDKRNTVKAMREILNLTQQELADKIGVCRETISKWENNHVLISGDNAQKIKELIK